MGFRSTFTSEDAYCNWPDWFRDKYAGNVWFGESGTIAAKHEMKTYGYFADLHADIQRAIDWSDWPGKFVLVFLHECGGVTRCQISKDAIKWSEPEGWRQTDGVTHDYCYGCSDI